MIGRTNVSTMILTGMIDTTPTESYQLTAGVGGQNYTVTQTLSVTPKKYMYLCSPRTKEDIFLVDK